MLIAFFLFLLPKLEAFAITISSQEFATSLGTIVGMIFGIGAIISAVAPRTTSAFGEGLIGAIFGAIGYLFRALFSAMGWIFRTLLPAVFNGSRNTFEKAGINPIVSAILALVVLLVVI